MSDNVCFRGDAGYIEPGSHAHKYETIGCSEVATILGYGFESNVDLWMRKTHRAAPVPHKRIFDRGHDMEPKMAKMIRDDYGRELRSEQVQYTDPDRPWLVYHADGMFPKWTPLNNDAKYMKGPGIWEAKAPGSHMADKMRSEGMTENYVCQGQLGMHVAAAALGIDVLWATYGFLHYDDYELVCFDAARSQSFIDGALPKIDEFYRCMVEDRPPEPVNPTEAEPVPEVKGGVEIVSDEDVARLAKQLAQLKEEVLDPAKAKEKLLKSQLQEHLKPFEAAEVPGVMKFSFRYGKPSEKIDGEGLLSYLEHVIAQYNTVVRELRGVQNPTYNPPADIKFDRTHWVTPKAPSRRFLPTVVKS